MKYAVSTYSFSQLIDSGKMTQLDCISKAKEMGFDGVELVDIANFADGDVLGYAKKLADEAERCGIELSNFAFTADLLAPPGDFGSPSRLGNFRKVDIAMLARGQKP